MATHPRYHAQNEWAQDGREETRIIREAIARLMDVGTATVSGDTHVGSVASQDGFGEENQEGSPTNPKDGGLGELTNPDNGGHIHGVVPDWG